MQASRSSQVSSALFHTTCRVLIDVLMQYCGGGYIDTIFNHMTGSDSGTGVAGSSYTHYNYPGIYQNQDFHHCGLEPNDDIVNYDNAVEVQTCQLVGLAE